MNAFSLQCWEKKSAKNKADKIRQEYKTLISAFV